jgi:hypothetical protein
LRGGGREHSPRLGELAIVDPKVVQGGTLNRSLCLWKEDVGSDEAVMLADGAQGDFPKLRLRPQVTDFKAYVRELRRPPQTVLVTVESRQ